MNPLLQVLLLRRFSGLELSSGKLGVEENDKMGRNHKLRIAIDCRIGDPRQGTGTAVLALAKALSDSPIVDQEYTFVVREELKDWLAPYIYGPCKLEGIPSSKLSIVKAAFRWLKPVKKFFRRWSPDKLGPLPHSDGYVESQQFDLVHFPTQLGYVTDLPSIYQPWDLQHVHYPQFFSPMEFAQRERDYKTFCDRASFVCVQAQWTKKDVVNCYGIAEEKIVVIPWGSVFDAYSRLSTEALQKAIEDYGLSGDFFFYPAVTWPHKNHEVIIRALHILKMTHGNTPKVYFTGSSTEYRTTLDKIARELGVFDQLSFLGFVTTEELQAIFATATAMIFPSKFEGFGLPILEAFHAHLPVLSSSATTLPEIAREGASYFDPDSPEELAALMKNILENQELRQELIRKGTMALSQYSINDTASHFQRLYKRTAELASQKQQLVPMSIAK